MLRHLLQQELKKNESLKAAEAKVAKLREQLQASERIVSANKTLLRKLREQVRQLCRPNSLLGVSLKSTRPSVGSARRHSDAGHEAQTPPGCCEVSLFGVV